MTEHPPAEAVAPDTGEQQSGKRAFISLFIPMLVVGGGLFLFDLISSTSKVARRGIASSRPPIYGQFLPGFSVWAIGAIACALVAGGAMFFIGRIENPRKRWAIPVVVALIFSFGTSLAMVKGDPFEFVRPLTRTHGGFADYQAEVPRVRQMGIRAFIKAHPQLVRGRALISVHSRTHPPGPEVVDSVLQSIFPRHLIPRAIVLAFFSSLVVIGTWFITLRLAGERAALVASFLMAVAPAPGVFIFLNFDAVFATLLAGAAALLVWGLSRNGRPWVAFLGGLLLGLSSIMTYAVLFVGAFALVYAFFARPPKEAIRALIYVAIGGVVALLFLRIAFGYDFLASYRASYYVVPKTKRSYLYWIFGNPATWLTFAGVPIAAYGLRELFFKRPIWFITFLAPLALADVTKIFPGETERIGQFAAPFLFAAAAAGIVRWERSSGRKRPGLLALLVIITAAQAILIQALFNTIW